MGIIDTLSAGFDTVRRRPWLVLVPVLLNVGLWLAPKLSVSTLVRSGLALLAAQAVGSPESLGNLHEAMQLMQEMADSLNLSSLLASSYLGVPSLPIGDTTSFFGWVRPVIEVGSGPGLLGLITALALAGLLIGALYLGLIAQEVRDGRTDWGRLTRRLLLYWLRLIGAFALMFGGLIFLALPVAVVFTILGLLSEGLASLLMAIVSFGIVWVLIYLAFVPEAIVLGEDGVVRAIWHSVNVVRVTFWSTLGIFVLVNMIMLGLAFVWRALTVSAAGALLAIAGNAYVGTGLTVALFIYYRDRFRAWRTAVEARNLPAGPVG